LIKTTSTSAWLDGGWRWTTYICEGNVVDVTSVRDRRRRLRRSFSDSDGARPSEEVDEPAAYAAAGAPGESWIIINVQHVVKTPD
jgi:hypothetical protein